MSTIPYEKITSMYIIHLLETNFYKMLSKSTILLGMQTEKIIYFLIDSTESQFLRRSMNTYNKNTTNKLNENRLKYS